MLMPVQNHQRQRMLGDGLTCLIPRNEHVITLPGHIQAIVEWNLFNSRLNTLIYAYPIPHTTVAEEVIQCYQRFELLFMQIVETHHLDDLGQDTQEKREQSRMPGEGYVTPLIQKVRKRLEPVIQDGVLQAVES
jgi:hypothetical protein